jgi:hypothetical protein
LYQRLHHHRVNDVRRHAQSALLAYAFLRGRRRSQIEGNRRKESPQVFLHVCKGVTDNVKRFGGADHINAVEAWLKDEAN